jgi:hypothetical protein
MKPQVLNLALYSNAAKDLRIHVVGISLIMCVTSTHLS